MSLLVRLLSLLHLFFLLLLLPLLLPFQCDVKFVKDPLFDFVIVILRRFPQTLGDRAHRFSFAS